MQQFQFVRKPLIMEVDEEVAKCGDTMYHQMTGIRPSKYKQLMSLTETAQYTECEHMRPCLVMSHELASRSICQSIKTLSTPHM